jgi:hypothetical protein
VVLHVIILIVVIARVFHVGLAVQKGDKLGCKRRCRKRGTKGVFVAYKEKLATLAKSVETNRGLGRTEVGLETLEPVGKARHHATKAAEVAAENGSSSGFVKEAATVGHAGQSFIGGGSATATKAQTVFIVVMVRVFHVVILVEAIAVDERASRLIPT